MLPTAISRCCADDPAAHRDRAAGGRRSLPTCLRGQPGGPTRRGCSSSAIASAGRSTTIRRDSCGSVAPRLRRWRRRGPPCRVDRPSSCRALRRPAPALARLVASSWADVFPRPARDARSSGVRRDASRPCDAMRRGWTAGHARRDAGLVVDGRCRDARVFRIPIGIDIEPVSARERRVAPPRRRSLGLHGRRVRRRLVPEGRRRLGGRARAEARQGPDVLVAALARVKERVPELVVLLTGRPGARERSRRARPPEGSLTVHRERRVAQ